MEILVLMLVLLLVGVGGFYLVCHIIKLWTGCNSNEAVTKLHNILNGKIQYSFSNDIGFANDVWDNVRNVIGSKRFEQLVNLSKTAITTPLLSFGENSGLPYIAISLYYEDDNEKIILENILTNLVKRYLQIYGLGYQVLVDWKIRYDLQMPFLEIRYARTAEEKRILQSALQNNQVKIVTSNNFLIDDTEEVELDG